MIGQRRFYPANTSLPFKLPGVKNVEIFFLKCLLFDRVRVDAPASIIASSSFTIGSKAPTKEGLAVIKNKELPFQDSVRDR